MTLPIVMTSAGPEPTAPATLNQEVIDNATLLAPGLTANLPGSLIEDMSSTATGALIVADQAVVDAINNVTPRGANEFVLGNLGTIYGVRPGVSANTSVYVVFSGDVGLIVPLGFIVSDGSHQYATQSPATIETSGQSAPTYCVATSTGTWAVAANTVINLVTSVPMGVTLSVTNPSAGTPATGAESATTYRARVIQAGLSGGTGMLTYLKTLIRNVTGVQERLVSVRAVTGGYQIIVGGGDPYAIAGAIYQGLFDITTLKGSVLDITAITQANPGVVTTELNHGYATGQSVTISGSDPSDYDGTYTATVLTEKTFSIATNTTGFAAYVGDAVASPNLRNQTVTVTDYPDAYDITFVVPPVQTVEIGLVWNTSSENVISDTAIQQMSAPALSGYINTIPVGLPINVFELQNTFMDAVSSVIPPEQVTKMIFTVNINGISTAPEVNTGIVNGDPESYFSCLVTDVSLTRA